MIGDIVFAGLDSSILFNELDENSDGFININELWSKSPFFRVSYYSEMSPRGRISLSPICWLPV